MRWCSGTGRRTTPGELQSQEKFSSNNLTILHQDEARYDGGGGWQGLYTNRVGRDVMRGRYALGPGTGLTVAWGTHPGAGLLRLGRSGPPGVSGSRIYGVTRGHRRLRRPRVEGAGLLEEGRPERLSAVPG